MTQILQDEEIKYNDTINDVFGLLLEGKLVGHSMSRVHSLYYTMCTLLLKYKKFSLLDKLAVD